jgi:hypothetical protein
MFLFVYVSLRLLQLGLDRSEGEVGEYCKWSLTRIIFRAHYCVLSAKRPNDDLGTRLEHIASAFCLSGRDST